MPTNHPATSAIQPHKSLAIFNILAFVVMVIANLLSIFLPLNGKSQMQLSAQYPNMFTPAGFTFSIWSIIYLFLLGFVVFQAIVLFRKQHPAKDKIIAISPLFIGICLCNAGWLFAWHYELVMLSVAIMLFYLIFLIAIHQKLRLALPWKPLSQKLWLEVPFSLNLGWICVATIANITAWCVQNHWGYSIFPEATWAIIMVAAGTLIALFYVLRNDNLFVGLVVMWSLYGGQSGQEQSGNIGADSIVTGCWFCIGLIFAAIIIQAFKRRKHSNLSAQLS